jgi:hypothetical protein
MLEEYLCLGGNEVANNARTYGYATTADCPLSWFRCAPCETLHDAINDWIPAEHRWVELGRNLATNPSMETATGTVELRRNLTLNPQGPFLSATTWGVMPQWYGATPGAGSTTHVAGATDGPLPGLAKYIRKTWTTSPSTSSSAGAIGFAYTGARIPVTAGQTYSFSFWMRPSWDMGPSGYFDTRIEFWDALTGGTQVSSATSPDVTAPKVNTWTLVTGTFTVPAGATYMNPIAYAQTTAGAVGNAYLPPVGATLDGTGFLAELASTTGPYFDGATRPALRINMAPTPYAGLWGFSAGGGTATAATVPDARFAGGASRRITFTAASTSTPFVNAGGNGGYFAVGEVWTFSARYAVDAGSVSGAFSWLLGGSTPPGASSTATVYTDHGDGTVTASKTFTITSLGGGTGYGSPILVWSGASATAVVSVGDTLWERASSYQPWFSGDSADAQGQGYEWYGAVNNSPSYQYDADFTTTWTGTVNASPSTLTARDTVSAASTTGQAVEYGTVDRPASGSYAARFLLSTGDAIGLGVASTVVLTTGTTYTLVMKVRANTRPVSVIPRIKATQGEAVALTVGQWTEIRTTQVAGSGSNLQTGLLLFAGGGHVAGDLVDVDDVALFEGSYTGSYFDGSTPDETHEPMEPGDIVNSWLGTANASQSIREQYTVITEGYSAAPQYTYANITEAPWYDAQKADLTSRFYGPWLISVTGVDDSTRTATVTESILDGGVVGLVRHASREILVRALLPARGDDALEYGLSWLDAVLAAENCSSHGSACGAVDMTFLAACPEPDEPGDIVLESEALTRHLHNVTVTSGPLILDHLRSKDGKHVANIVEWTMVAGTPWVFGQMRPIEVQPTVPVVIQDVPYNLTPYPSAELSGAAVIVSTNYSANPSLETNATGWTSGTTGVTPAPTGARSTELASVGVASYKVAVTTTNSSAASGSIYAIHDITLPTYLAGQKFSISAWLAGFVVGGTASLTQTRLRIEWRDASTTVQTDTIGTGVLNGGVISGKSLVRPATAITARVVAILDIASWSVGAQINLFVDAVALTNP